MLAQGGSAVDAAVATAITLTCRIVSQKPDAAILGNITFGRILVNNQPVPAPFTPLNLLSA